MAEMIGLLGSMTAAPLSEPASITVDDATMVQVYQSGTTARTVHLVDFTSTEISTQKIPPTVGYKIYLRKSPTDTLWADNAEIFFTAVTYVK